MEEQNDDKRVMIFGYSKSRLEVFLNGIAFMFIHIAYEVFCIANQLPKKWVLKDVESVDRPFLIPMILFLFSYYLMSHALFGGEERGVRMQEKYGNIGILIRRYSLILSIGIVSFMTPVYIILLFF